MTRHPFTLPAPFWIQPWASSKSVSVYVSFVLSKNWPHCVGETPWKKNKTSPQREKWILWELRKWTCLTSSMFWWYQRQKILVCAFVYRIHRHTLFGTAFWVLPHQLKEDMLTVFCHFLPFSKGREPARWSQESWVSISEDLKENGMEMPPCSPSSCMKFGSSVQSFSI